MPGLLGLEWKGSTVDTSSRVISFLKARDMIEKGCLAYLAYVWDTTAKSLMIDSVPVVREFTDVFPSNLPSMPSDRDIDFCIDLAPGTHPISIPPYRMSSKELKELKEQLEELLAKGFVRPNLVKDALEKVKLIQERLHTAQFRQKSYADQKAHDVSFMVGEKVLLKVSLMKGVLRFGKKGKLSPRFIGPFEVLRRVGEVAYELALPPNLSGVHLVFHVSLLQKYHADLSHVLDFSTIQLDESLGYEEEPVAIIDRQDRQLRSKRISAVKVQWRVQPVEEVTWESEEDTRSRYPHLFPSSGTFYVRSRTNICLRGGECNDPTDYFAF
ncbi:uncharacterized protein [Nicotiana sylvestris]|uniref:uncharacterized protein n=1 Tax=Nicotiana sylvestris TaxID=4096 RepID=UPI00388C7EFC